jgi:hypothetical protein
MNILNGSWRYTMNDTVKESIRMMLPNKEGEAYLWSPKDERRGSMRCRASVVLIVLLALSACATASTPSNKLVYVSPDSESKMGRIERGAIIADVCLLRDVLGEDYWVVQESRSAGGHMLDAAKTYLAGKGYEVSYAQAPFVGAFKNREKPLKVRYMNGREIIKKNPPLFESEGVADNQVFKEALLTVVPKVLASQGPIVYSEGRKPIFSDVCCADPEVKDHMKVIAEHTGGDATLFLIGYGTVLSAGKNTVQGLEVFGLVAAMFTLPVVGHAMSKTEFDKLFDESYLDTYAVLVDNNTGEILWANAMKQGGGKFSDKEYYDAEKWPKLILHYMPSRAEMKAEER